MTGEVVTPPQGSARTHLQIGAKGQPDLDVFYLLESEVRNVVFPGFPSRCNVTEQLGKQKPLQIRTTTTHTGEPKTRHCLGLHSGTWQEPLGSVRVTSCVAKEELLLCEMSHNS